MLNGFIEVGDNVFFAYLLPGTPGKIKEKSDESCTAVFFGDVTKPVEVSRHPVEKIVKESGLIVVPAVHGEKCSFCENKAVYKISKDGFFLYSCADRNHVNEAMEGIVLRCRKEARKEKMTSL